MGLPDLLVIAALAVIVAITMLVSGCTTSASNDQTTPQGGLSSQGYGNYGPGPGRGMMGNLTDAQRGQFFQQMSQACQGKADGDSCILQSPRGNRTGTCKTMNETLLCNSGMGGPRGNRTTQSSG